MNRRKTTIPEVLDNLRQVVKLTREHSRREKCEGGLSSSQIRTLSELFESGPLRVSDLARRMHRHPSTLIRMLARLETSGFVTRSRSESDRRVVEISLTETGREISGRLPEGKRSYLLMQMETLGQEELHRLSEAMSLLVGMLKTPEVP